MRSQKTRLTRQLLLVALVVAVVLLALCQVALASAASSFTLNEVNKAGTVQQIGTWTYDATNHTLTGAPFVQALTSTDYQGTTLPYLPFSGQDAYTSNTKMAVATKGIYVDDLATWVAGQNSIPLGSDTAFNVTTADNPGVSYYASPLTLAGVDNDRYWYPSYNFSATPATATWDDGTRVARKAVLAIQGNSLRRYQTTPTNPTDYATLLTSLGNMAASVGDTNSLQLWMGQVKGNYTDLNLGNNAAKYVDSLTFTPVYETIASSVTGGGTASITTDDGYLKATAGEPVSFTIGNVTSGYSVDSVTVTDSSSQSVAVNESSGTYSFTMPASNASIAVHLKAASVAVTGVTIAPKNAVLTAGDILQLAATVSPASATNQSVIWTSSAPAVATVSLTGMVTTLTAGTTTIAATTADGGGFTDTCALTVDPSGDVLTVKHSGGADKTYTMAQLRALAAFQGIAGYRSGGGTLTGPDAVTGVDLKTIVADALGHALRATETVTVAQTVGGSYARTFSYDRLTNFTGFTMYNATSNAAVSMSSLTGTLKPVLVYSDPQARVMPAAKGPLRFLIGDTAAADNVVMTPSSDSVSNTDTVTVTELASNIAVNAGDAQTAQASTAVATAPSVKVTDTDGVPFSGVSVTFAVASGGGNIGATSATTDANGIASCGSWTLGATPGANTLTATAAGLTGSPVTFSATATAEPTVLTVKLSGTTQKSYTMAQIKALTAWTGYAGVWRGSYANGPDAVTGVKLTTLVQDALGTSLAATERVQLIASDLFTRTFSYDRLTNFTGFQMYNVTSQLPVAFSGLTGQLASVIVYDDPAGNAMSPAAGPLRFFVGDAAAGNADNVVMAPANDSVQKVAVLDVQPITVTDVTVAPTSVDLNADDPPVQLTATVLPSDAANKTVTWTSNNPSAASVDADGLVTPHAEGSAIITVTTQDGSHTAACGVTVHPALIHVTGVTLSTGTSTLLVNDTLQLTATVAPADATSKSVTWASSDPTVASVTTSGLVTALKTGAATITVTTADRGKTGSCAVTVTTGSAGISTTDDATGEWSNDPVTVHFTASTVAPGEYVSKTLYQVDGGAEIDGDSVTILAPINHSNDGVHTISYYSVDTDGHKEATTHTCLVKIDTTDPVVNGLVPAADGRYAVDSKVPVAWSVQNVAGKAGAQVSDIEVEEARIDGVLNDTVAKGTKIGDIRASGLPLSATTHTIHLVVTDAAGNETDVDNDFTLLDATNDAPVTVDDAPNEWQNSDVKVSFIIDSIASSGLAYTEYSLDGGTTYTQGDSVTITAPGDHSHDGINTIWYRSVDNDGKTETAHSCTVKIDTTAPDVSAVLPAEEAAYGMGTDQHVTWTAIDKPGKTGVAVSGLNDADGAEQTATIDGEPVSAGDALDDAGQGAHVFALAVADAAGNETMVSNAFTNVAETITVSKPVAGAQWRNGTGQTVRFAVDYPLAVGQYGILLVRSGQSTPLTTITANGASSYAYDWTVAGGAGSGYSIEVGWRLGASGDFTVIGQGGSFSILPPQALTVTAPDATSVWAQKSTQTVTWHLQQALSSGSFTVKLIPAANPYRAVTKTVGVKTGVTSYATKLRVSGSYKVGSYTVQVSCGSLSSVSPQFQIVPERALRVTNPVSHVIWSRSADHSVSWTLYRTLAGTSFDLYLKSATGKTYSLGSYSPGAVGPANNVYSYTQTIPAARLSGVTTGANYRLIVRWQAANGGQSLAGRSAAITVTK